MFNLKKIGVVLCANFIWPLAVIHTSHATETSSTQTPFIGKTPTLFDQPLSEKRLPLARNTDFAEQKIEVACFYYPGFMVKEQVDTNNKGAVKLAMTPVSTTSSPPICQSAATADEKIIAGNPNFSQDAWNGYFMGAKGPYVFFRADDGNLIGGMNFAIFDSADAKWLFTDGFSNHPGRIDTMKLSPTGLYLRYQRTYQLPCSPNTKDSAANLCQARIKKETGLRLFPSCARKYQQGDGIHYPVRVLLEKTKPPKIIPTKGKTTCIRSI